MAKKYVGETTLQAILELIKTQLATAVTVSDIITDLDSYTAEDGDNYVVAAATLKEILGTIQETLENQGTSVDEIVAAIEPLLTLVDEDGSTVLALTVDDILSDWDAYDADDARAVVSAALVKAIKDAVAANTESISTLETTVSDIQTTITEMQETASDSSDAIESLTTRVATIEADYTTSEALATAVEEGLTTAETYADENFVKLSSVGVAGGVASLDDSGLVPSSQLPSYVDDVIEGYLVDGVFYEPDEEGTAASTTAITGEKGKIYVDLTDDKCYRWSGTTYVVVSSSEDLVEITEDEVEEIWNEVLASLETE